MKTIQLVGGPYDGKIAEVGSIIHRVSAPVLDLPKRHKKIASRRAPTFHRVIYHEDHDQPEGETPRRFLFQP
jgi:hypothetical protein